MIKEWSRHIAKKLGWRVDHARDFAVSLLTEVNDHDMVSHIMFFIEAEKEEKNESPTDRLNFNS